MKLKKIISVIAVITTIATMCAGCMISEAKAEIEWSKEEEITVVSRAIGSGTRKSFVDLFGIEENGEDLTTNSSEIVISTSAVTEYVEEDIYAIGYISLGGLNDKVKALEIDGVMPSVETIMSGEYEVVRPFHINIKKDTANLAALDLADFIMSKEGQKMVEESGYISVSDGLPYQPSGISGSVVIGGSTSVAPLMEKIFVAYNEVNPNVKLEIKSSDSLMGVEQVKNGSYDIGMTSRIVNESEDDLSTVVMAQDGIAVVVNNRNEDVNELTKEQVRGIYLGELAVWNEISNVN